MSRYYLYVIPLDTANVAEMKVELINTINFDPGSYDQNAIKTLVSNNLVWQQMGFGFCDAWVAPYQIWRDTTPARRVNLPGLPNLQTVRLRLAPGQPDITTYQQRLLDYLGASATVGQPALTNTYHARKSADFVDLNDALRGLHQSTYNLRNRAATHFSSLMHLNDDISKVSLPLNRWVDAASRASILEKVYPASADTPQSSLDIDQSDIRSLRDAAGKIKKRAAATQQVASNGLYASGQTTPLDPTDLNAAFHAALRDPFMSQYLGLRTSWICDAQFNLSPGAYVIQISDLSIALLPEYKPPVAFIRGKHTHPAGFYDVNPPAGQPTATTTGLFVQLNKTASQGYSTSCIDAEKQLARDIVLQGSNSLAAPANHSTFANTAHEAPFLLKQQRAGSSEPTTSGVVFNAAVTDLITPVPLAPNGIRDSATWPCLFLEDLWIGYRLETKRRSDSKFLSIHRSQKYCRLRSGTLAPNGGSSAAVWVEDFIDRDQQDAGPGKPSSTSFYTYNGFTKQQMEDYRLVMDLPQDSSTPPAHSFQSIVTDFKASEPLIFGQDYDYRLRTVFLGAIGAPPGLPASEAGSDHVQGFSFFRPHAFRPGELLLRSSLSAPQNLDGGTLYLTVYNTKQSVFLLPSPIDLDTARFEGLLFQSENELSDHGLTGRNVVTDLGQFVSSTDFNTTNYFLEPRVSSVFVRITMVNGDMRNIARTINGPGPAILHVREHVQLNPIEVRFGADGSWKNFRPIELAFQALTVGATDVTTTLNGQKLTIRVPPAAELHISIIPSIPPDNVVKTAAFAPTTWQYGAAMPQFSPNTTTLPPTVIAESTLRVVYAVEEPLLAPQMRATAAAPGIQAPSTQIVLALRSASATMATPQVRVDLDAPSSKELYLDSTWTDIGNASSTSSIFGLQPGQARSQSHSLIFRQVEPYEPTVDALNHYLGIHPQAQLFPLDLVDQFHHQECEETVVTIVADTSTGAAQTEGTGQSTLAIDFGDARRKWGTVQAVAVSRFADRFPNNTHGFEQRSQSLSLDVPSAVLLTAPHIQSIRHLKSIEKLRDSNSVYRRSTFALRLYLAGNPFASGIGQRVAIGFAAGAFSAIDPQTYDLVNYATLWGEDPIDRPRLGVSQRHPHASDFGSPYATAKDADLDANCYPPNAVAGDAPVLYRDNLLVGAVRPGTGHFISIASYALSYDSQQQLWYFDVVTTTGFRGWLRLALFMHQPHAANGCEISPTATCVYASSLGDEVITWRHWLGRIYVSIGPAEDPNVTYELDTLTYRDGVSVSLDDSSTQPAVPLTQIELGRDRYFEGNVSDGNQWNWVKRRFGAIVDSGEIALS